MKKVSKSHLKSSAPSTSPHSASRHDQKNSDEYPLISIVIPFYNAEKYLERCLNSVLTQTYPNLEIVLIDNNSTDNSTKICQDFISNNKLRASNSNPSASSNKPANNTSSAPNTPHISLHTCKTPGVSAARNLGLKKASGDWIVFLDSDDTLENNFCELMLKTALSESVDYVCCGYNRVAKSDITAINANNSVLKYSAKDFTLKVLNPSSGYGFVHTKLIRSPLAKSASFDESLTIAEDTLYNLKLLKNLTTVAVINVPLYNYYVNPASAVHNYSENYVTPFKTGLDAIISYLQSAYPDTSLTTAINNFVAHHLLLILVNFCAHPKNPNPVTSLKTVLSTPPFKASLKHIKLGNFPLTHRIVLLFLKLHLYHSAIFIAKIRLKRNGADQ